MRHVRLLPPKLGPALELEPRCGHLPGLSSVLSALPLSSPAATLSANRQAAPAEPTGRRLFLLSRARTTFCSWVRGVLS